MKWRPSATAAVSFVLGLLAVTGASAQDADAQRVLERYRNLRPTAQDLIMYRLDWAQSFDEARTRAVKEHRPVLVIAIHARYGDMYTGHC